MLITMLFWQVKYKRWLDYSRKKKEKQEVEEVLPKIGQDRLLRKQRVELVKVVREVIKLVRPKMLCLCLMLELRKGVCIW